MVDPRDSVMEPRPAPTKTIPAPPSRPIGSMLLRGALPYLRRVVADCLTRRVRRRPRLGGLVACVVAEFVEEV